MRALARCGTALILGATIACYCHGAIARADTKKPELLFMGTKVLLGTLQSLHLKIDDQITDGCWPNPQAAKNTVELALRNSGYKIASKQELFTPDVILLGFGVSTKTSNGRDGPCNAFIKLTVYTDVNISLPFTYNEHAQPDREYAIVSLETWSRASILGGPKNGMQERIRNQFHEWAEELVLDIKRAQDEIFRLRPDIREKFEAIHH